MVTVLEGAACLMVGGEEYHITRGKAMVTPTESSQTLYVKAVRGTRLTVVLPQKAP